MCGAAAGDCGGSFWTKFDPSERGLRKFLHLCEERALRYMWEVGENGADSVSIWRSVAGRLPPDRSISRSSVELYLEGMVERGVLGVRDAAGGCAHGRRYYPRLGEEDFVAYYVRAILRGLMEDFPEESRKVLDSFAVG